MPASVRVRGRRLANERSQRDINMSMEKAILNDMGTRCYNAARIDKIINRLGQGDAKDGVMILAYAGIPIYLVSEYDMDQIYQTIVESKRRGGETCREIIIWLNGQPMESRLRDDLITQLRKSA